MILAMYQHHNLKPCTFQSEFRTVYCCLVQSCCSEFVGEASSQMGKNTPITMKSFKVVEVASHLTPVPGGVGPMTVAMLMYNTVQVQFTPSIWSE